MEKLPFGIKSAPEIFQRKMHELIEGLIGVEVIADDFVVVGRTLLVVSNYFSGFIEVSRLQTITTQAVVRELKTIFARFGVQETLVTDNGS